MQVHALGEVGILGTVLLRVFSETLLAIFIEIGSYLTEKEQKISWHSFFETRCILLLRHSLLNDIMSWSAKKMSCSEFMHFRSITRLIRSVGDVLRVTGIIPVMHPAAYLIMERLHNQCRIHYFKNNSE